MRLGLAAESTRWRIGHFELLDANRNRRIQICDLLSNSSHDNYRRCGTETATRLKAAFGIYDQTLVRHPLIEKLNLFVEEGSYGLAIRTIAERDIKDRLSDDIQSKAIANLELLIDNLANLTVTVRDSHLKILIAWLEQIVGQQRSLDLGYEIIFWLREKLEKPLADKLGDARTSLCWFAYSLHCWALTIYNHQGKLDEARQEAKAMKYLIPHLAGHWELVPLLMRGLVAEAVHHTDCWEYYEAVKSMYSVIRYYHDLSSLFVDAFPKVFPQQIRSQLKAKAIGTWLQTEIHALAFLPHRESRVRAISNICIREFPNIEDKQRQYQYRTQLETITKNFNSARKYLAKSLDLEDSSHGAIAQKIVTLNTIPQGFALLHWLRLGTTACLSDNTTEWTEFSQALQRSRLLNNNWCRGTQSLEYPTYGILRRVALINVILHRPDTALGRLRNLNPIGKKNLVFGAIQMATYAEVAALKWQSNLTHAQDILTGYGTNFGLLEIIEILANKSYQIYPVFWQLTQSWSKSISDILNNETNSELAVQKRLLKIGATVNY